MGSLDQRRYEGAVMNWLRKLQFYASEHPVLTIIMLCVIWTAFYQGMLWGALAVAGLGSSAYLLYDVRDMYANIEKPINLLPEIAAYALWFAIGLMLAMGVVDMFAFPKENGWTIRAYIAIGVLAIALTGPMVAFSRWMLGRPRKNPASEMTLDN